MSGAHSSWLDGADARCPAFSAAGPGERVPAVVTSQPLAMRAWGRWTLFVILAAAFGVMQYNPNLLEGFARDLDDVIKESDAGNLARQASILVVGFAGAVALLKRGAPLRARGALAFMVLAYVSLFPLSATWADDPYLTLRRIVAFGMMNVAAIACVRRLRAADIVQFAILGAGAHLLVCVVVELSKGAFHPGQADYRFSGISHPNSTAASCAILVLAAISSIDASRRRWPLVLAALAGFFFLVLTRSRTSLGCVLVVAAVRFIATARAPRTIFALLVAGWLAAAAAFLVGGESAARRLEGAFLMGRGDSDVRTLTGRTALWADLMPYVARRPWLGYGAGGFWSPQHAREVSLSQRWSIGIGHSTYIDYALEFGIVGLVTYVLMMCSGCWRALRLARRTREAGYVFMLCVLSFTLLIGALETVAAAPSILSFLIQCALGWLAFRATPTTSAQRC